MLEQVRHTRLYRLTEGAARLLARLGFSANAVTGLGFVFSLGAAYLIATGHLVWGAVVVLVGGLCDMLDGALARLRGSSQFGALLDSTLDRVSEAALLFGLLALYARQGATGRVLLVYAALVGSVLVSYVRARAEGLGLSYKGGVLTRAERMLLLVLGLLLNGVSGGISLLVVLWLLVVLGFLTAAQRLWYFRSHAGDK